jgi:hypothetical protein
MFLDVIENSEVLIILFEKGLLALVVLFAGFLFNWILQTYKLKREAANQIASDRSKAYLELWKALAAIRPRSDEVISKEKKDEIEKVLVDWYHTEAFALYMSWGTARKYMLLRKALDEKPINSDKVRKRVSRLRTQLKVDCGIYSGLEAILPLPKPKKLLTKPSNGSSC